MPWLAQRICKGGNDGLRAKLPTWTPPGGSSSARAIDRGCLRSAPTPLEESDKDNNGVSEIPSYHSDSAGFVSNNSCLVFSNAKCLNRDYEVVQVIVGPRGLRTVAREGLASCGPGVAGYDK